MTKKILNEYQCYAYQYTALLLDFIKNIHKVGHGERQLVFSVYNHKH